MVGDILISNYVLYGLIIQRMPFEIKLVSYIKPTIDLDVINEVVSFDN